MRKVMLLISVLLAMAAPAAAQVVGTQYVTVASTGTCVNGSNCASFQVPTTASMSFDVSGTFSGTLTFEGTIDGVNYRTTSVIDTSTGAAASTATAGGTWTVANIGYQVLRLRATSWASGQARVTGTAGRAMWWASAGAASCTLDAAQLTAIAGAIWNATRASYVTAGSFGQYTNANLTAIDALATNGNNATLNLKQLNIVNSAGDALVASSTGGNGNGIAISGNGSGSGSLVTAGLTGIGSKIRGGATSGRAVDIQAVGGGEAIYFQSAGNNNAAVFQATGDDGVGLTGFYDGILAVGSDDGAGIRARGGLDGIAAMGYGTGGGFVGDGGVAGGGPFGGGRPFAAGDGGAMDLKNLGTGPGLRVWSGTTGNTAAVLIENQNAAGVGGPGIYTVGTLAGAGLRASGGSTDNVAGILSSCLATNCAGISAIGKGNTGAGILGFNSTGTGFGIYGLGTSGPGIFGSATTSGDGMVLTGVGTGKVGLNASNGASFGFTQTNIATNTTTTVKSGAGVLHAINMNAGATTGQAVVYDNTAGSGTVIATLTLTAGTMTSVIYDRTFATGLTIVTTAGAGAPNIDVLWK